MMVDSCLEGRSDDIARCKADVGNNVKSCKQDVKDAVDSCKRRVRSDIAACKDKVEVQVAACKEANKQRAARCKDQVRRDIDKMKKKCCRKVSYGFGHTKICIPGCAPAAEATRPIRMGLCEIGRAAAMVCEAIRARATTCEGKRPFRNAFCETAVRGKSLGCEISRTKTMLCEGKRLVDKLECEAKAIPCRIEPPKLDKPDDNHIDPGLACEFNEGCTKSCLNITVDTSPLVRETMRCNSACVDSVDAASDDWLEMYTKCTDACTDSFNKASVELQRQQCVITNECLEACVVSGDCSDRVMNCSSTHS